MFLVAINEFLPSSKKKDHVAKFGRVLRVPKYLQTVLNFHALKIRRKKNFPGFATVQVAAHVRKVYSTCESNTIMHHALELELAPLRIGKCEK